MKVELDGNRCVSSGQCVMSAPDVFDQSEVDGVSFVRDAEPGPETEEAVREAVSLCPVGAITLLED
ncbi:ferredoxin [Streptomyces sp. NPDC091377]|uniref:ferredoxin n=1 Tax=Streptomyces sp. NPDC091377 TaxID=3365995 RepID=UPI0038121DBE